MPAFSCVRAALGSRNRNVRCDASDQHRVKSECLFIGCYKLTDRGITGRMAGELITLGVSFQDQSFQGLIVENLKTSIVVVTQISFAHPGGAPTN